MSKKNKITISFGGNKLRFLGVLLILFISTSYGYTNTRSFFSNYEISYGIHTVVFLFGSLIFSFGLYKKRMKRVYIVFIALFFISYLLKFYLIIHFTYFSDLTIYRLALYSPRILKYMTQESLIDSFRLSSTTYFCLSVLALFDLHSIYEESKKKMETRRIASKYNIVSMSLIVLICFIIISLARKILSENNQDSYFIVLSTYFVPLLYIYLMNISLSSGYLYLSKKIAYMFIFTGVVQFVLFTSKLYIVLPILWIMIFQYLYGVKFINNKYIFVFFIPLIVLYPILNIYREVALDGEGQILLSVIERFMDAEGNHLITGILSVFYRLVGIDSLLVLIAEKGSAYSSYGLLNVLANEKSISHILTYDIIGYDFVMGVAPTLLGQIYFTTGHIIISALIFTLYVYLVSNAFSKLIRQRSMFMKTLAVYLIVYAVIYYNEGVLMSNIKYQAFGLLMFSVFYHLFSNKKINL